MNINKKTDFTKSLNLQKQTLLVKSDLAKRELFFLERIQDSKRYKQIVIKNTKLKGKKYKIAEVPINVSGMVDSTNIFNNILKDIFIRYELGNNNLVEHKLIFTSDITEQDLENQAKEKEKLKEDRAKLKNKKAKNIADFIKLRDTNVKKIEERITKQIIKINNLGTIMNYKDKFLTSENFDFQANTLDTFWQMYKEGRVYADIKPAYWCTEEKKELDKNQIEYEKNEVMATYILCEVEDDKGLFKENTTKNIFFVASTIRPWSLISTNYLAVAKNLEYSLVEFKEKDENKYFIIATDFVDDIMQYGFYVKYDIVNSFWGKDLEGVVLKNPLEKDNNSSDKEKQKSKENSQITVIGTSNNKVVIDKKVSTGVSIVSNSNSYLDFSILKENNISRGKNLISILDLSGNISGHYLDYTNLTIKEASEKIVDILKQNGLVYYEKNTSSKKMKCKKCKKDVIYKEMSEWFITKNDYRYDSSTLENFLSKTSSNTNYKEKIFFNQIQKINNVKERGISDARIIGTPVPVFYCADCGKAILTKTTVETIKNYLKKKGIVEWHKHTPEEIAEGQVACECGCTFLFKDESIINDFFELVASVLNETGGDEEITNLSIDSTKELYRKLLVYSFAIEPENEIKKTDRYMVHPVVEEGIGAETELKILELVKEYGTDVLRLWVMANSNKNSMKIDKSAIVTTQKVYLKIRRTFKFMLSNLYDYNDVKNKVGLADRNDLDKVMYKKLEILVKRVNKAYAELNFISVYTDVINFCDILLCDRYFEAIKHNLYVLDSNNKRRRSVQSTLYNITMILFDILTPILPFTMEEVWPYIWHQNAEDGRNPLNTKYSITKSEESFKDETNKWKRIFEIKDKIIKSLKEAVNKKEIKSFYDAKVTISTSEDEKNFIDNNYYDVIKSVNVSLIETIVSDTFSVKCSQAPGVPCVRCKTVAIDIGKDLKYRYLCPNCAKIMNKIEKSS